jgi:hypothetical protein
VASLIEWAENCVLPNTSLAHGFVPSQYHYYLDAKSAPIKKNTVLASTKVFLDRNGRCVDLHHCCLCFGSVSTYCMTLTVWSGETSLFPDPVYREWDVPPVLPIAGLDIGVAAAASGLPFFCSGLVPSDSFTFFFLARPHLDKLPLVPSTITRSFLCQGLPSKWNWSIITYLDIFVCPAYIVCMGRRRDTEAKRDAHAFTSSSAAHRAFRTN